MDRRTALLILRKFEENTKLERYIKTHWVLCPGSRLRRGVVLDQITRDLGLTVNIHLHQKIRKVMESMGVRHIKVDGKAYWGELAYRDSICKETE